MSHAKLNLHFETKHSENKVRPKVIQSRFKKLSPVKTYIGTKNSNLKKKMHLWHP